MENNKESLNERRKGLTPSATTLAILRAASGGAASGGAASGGAASGGAVICPSVSPLAISALDALQKGAQVGGGMSAPGASHFAAIRAGIERDVPRIEALNQRLAEKEAENEQLRATIRTIAGRN